MQQGADIYTQSAYLCLSHALPVPKGDCELLKLTVLIALQVIKEEKWGWGGGERKREEEGGR